MRNTGKDEYEGRYEDDVYCLTISDKGIERESQKWRFDVRGNRDNLWTWFHM